MAQRDDPSPSEDSPPDDPIGNPESLFAGGDAKPKKSLAFAGIGLVIALLPIYGIFQWFFCRIEVPQGRIAVLIAKTGENLPSGQILARKPGQKGIQLEVLKTGRHFRNPFFWDWEIHPLVDIEKGEVGVLTRIYGEAPSDLSGNLLVPMDSELKGIVADVLKSGQYPINPYAYGVEKFPAIEVKAGFVGVVCDRVGTVSAQANTYLVQPGERGVQTQILGQGAHYLNPYAVTVYPVDLRSQRLEFSDRPDSSQSDQQRKKALSPVHFPSSDGFEIEVHLTVEWSIDQARASDVFVRIGTGDPNTLLDEVLYKTLIPALRGNARIAGSKYPAANYISGESRTVFQTTIEESLKAVCSKQGIIIRSVLVNDIEPPQDIAGPIRDREVAKEELARNKIQLEQAVAEQSLARETALVEQETARVAAETELKKAKIDAENRQSVALIEQQKLLNVAQADLKAAKNEAEAILARGKAEAAVITANNVAEAEALRKSVAAFKTPSGFAAYSYAQRLAPAVRTVFADPEGPFGKIFSELLDPGPPASNSTGEGQ